MPIKKIGFSIQEELLDEVRDYVNARRGAPHFFSLNNFLALALRNEMKRGHARTHLELDATRRKRERDTASKKAKRA